MVDNPLQPRKDNQTLALVLAAVGVCCFPLGVVGGILGLTSFLRARREGRPAGLSVVAMVFACLSIGVAGWSVFFAIQQEAARSARLKAVNQKLAGKLDRQALDAEVACDLATQYLLDVKSESLDTVTCAGPFTAGPVGKLEGVTCVHGAEKTVRTVCFARAHRWYVLSVPGDGACAGEPPVAGPATRPADDKGLRAEEDALRLDESQRRAKTLIASFDEQLRAAQKAVSGEHVAKNCPQWKEPVKAAYIDYELLPSADSTEQAWDILTHADVRRALKKTDSLDSRGMAVDTVLSKSPYLVVFQGTDAKDWPKVSGSGYVMGTFSGWMSVVDLKSRELVCDAPLEFTSSGSVGGGIRLKYAPKKSTKELAEDDFEDAFETAATRAAREMSGGQLKLGLKLLE
jgi:hypothetical protein